jgi:hypothetical protein
MNSSASKSVGLKRIAVKGKKELYKNAQWDLVDAAKDSATFLDKLDVKTLPDSLKTKTKNELKLLVTQKATERSNIQTEIANNSILRDKYIAAEKAKLANAGTAPTLETEIEKIIKQQAKRFNMTIQ